MVTVVKTQYFYIIPPKEMVVGDAESHDQQKGKNHSDQKKNL